MDFKECMNIIQGNIAIHGIEKTADMLGVKYHTLRSWFTPDKGKEEPKTPNARDFLAILSRLGYVISSINQHLDITRDVCFTDTRIVPAGEGHKPPVSENYLAVPLVGEVGAGPGLIDQGSIKSWILVYKQHHSVERRSNLLAVEVGRNQRSMIPTLHPEDIVLVDRNDWGENSRYSPPGNIYLVREPGQEGGGMVKRVSLSSKDDEQIIIFYSDNKEYTPDLYKISAYNNNIRNAIVGKVVWAWADLSQK
jgi:hypothetical protein